MEWLARLRRDRRRSAQVVVLTRAGCHLCVQMEQVVTEVVRAGTRRPVTVTLVDLDEAGREDPELLARYDTLVPVLLVDDAVVAYWRVDQDGVRAALR